MKTLKLFTLLSLIFVLTSSFKPNSTLSNYERRAKELVGKVPDKDYKNLTRYWTKNELAEAIKILESSNNILADAVVESINSATTIQEINSKSRDTEKSFERQYPYVTRIFTLLRSGSHYLPSAYSERIENSMNRYSEKVRRAEDLAKRRL